MELEVRLFTGLKCENELLPSFGQNEFQMEAPTDITVGKLQQILGLRSKYVLINMVNGVARSTDW